jgi:hypothetical protein
VVSIDLIPVTCESAAWSACQKHRILRPSGNRANTDGLTLSYIRTEMASGRGD